ncbi:unnamed protein product [Prunus armeniaca]
MGSYYSHWVSLYITPPTENLRALPAVLANLGLGGFGSFRCFQQCKGARAGGGGQQPGLARGGVRPERLPAG